MRRNILEEKYSIESSVSTKRSLKDNYIPITDMRLRDLSKEHLPQKWSLAITNQRVKRIIKVLFMSLSI